MSPATAIQLALLVIKEAPQIYAALGELLNKRNVTNDDWEELFEKAGSKSYEDYVAPQPGNPS